MSFADSLVKISLSHGYSRLVGAVESIVHSVSGPARSGLWETTVEFQGEWYEDEGNQKTLGVLLADQDLYLVDVTATERGSLLFHVAWGDDIEWRKGKRDRKARKEARKQLPKQRRLPRDPTDPEYQEFLEWSRRFDDYKAEQRNTEEYREWRAAKQRHQAKKQALMSTGEYAQYQLEKHEHKQKRRAEQMRADFEHHQKGREGNRAKRGLAPEPELPPFPAWVPPELIRNIALPVKVERSVVAEAGHFITDLAPKPSVIVVVPPRHQKVDLPEAEAREKAKLEVEAKRAVEAAAAAAAASKKQEEQQERALAVAEAKAIAEEEAAKQLDANNIFLAGLKPGDHVGSVKNPKGPVKVDLTDGERLMCRCGQSDFYPFCDQGCKAINAAKGTTFSPWKASVETTGLDVIYACGCGQSKLFRVGGEAQCDNTCGAGVVPTPSAEAQKAAVDTVVMAAEEAKRREAEEKEKAAAAAEVEKQRAAHEAQLQKQREEEAAASAKAAEEAAAAAAAAAAASAAAAAAAAAAENKRREELLAQERAEQERAEQEAKERAAANARALEAAKEQQAREEAEKLARLQREAEAERAAAEAEALRVQAVNVAAAEQQQNARPKTWRDLSEVPIPARLLILGRQRDNSIAYQFSQTSGWGSVSWNQYTTQVEVAAKSLMSVGLPKGGRVAIMSDTRPEWAVLALAVQLAGGVLVIVPPSSTADQVLEIVQQTQPVVFVVDDVVHWERLARVADQPVFVAVKHFISIQTIIRHHKGLSWYNFLAKASETSEAALEGRFSTLKMSDLGTICYSDNRLQVNPQEMRGAKLSLGNEAFAADSYTELLSFGPNDKMLVFMPFSDTANRSLSIHQAVNSGSVTFFGEEIDKLHANLTSVQPTVIYSAPVLWERFEAVIKARLGSGDPAALPQGVKEKLRRFIGCHNLRVAISGSALIHADTIRFYEALGITLRNMYTKSALSGICTLDMGSTPLLGGAGKAVPGVQIRTAANGAIEVQGPNVFMGYHNRQAQQGWFQTGDSALINENGDLIVTGHLTNLFRLKSGVEVHPEPIELELRTSPIISGAYVFGNGRDFVAAIVAIEREALSATAKKLGKTVDEVAQSPETLKEVDEHIHRVNAKLPESHRIKKYRVIPREFSFKDNECTPTMLLNRSVVATKFAALRAEIFG